MKPSLARIGQSALAPPRLARNAGKDRGWLNGVMAGLASETPRVKYGCAKALRILSESRPGVLYPHFDFFAGLLGHPNKILQWEGAFMLARLARVDPENKFEAVFDRYFAPVRGPVMITAANVIRGAAQIALAKPTLADRIAGEILKVSSGRYQTPECRNVAIGHALLALEGFLHLVRDRAPVLQFARRQLRNSRPATRKKAGRLLARASQLMHKPMANPRLPVVGSGQG